MFLSWRLAGNGGGGRGVCRRGRGPHATCQYLPSRKVACNSIGRSFNKVRKRCNSNDLNSRFEIVLGELHAKLVVGSGMRGVRAGCEGRGPSRGLACEGSEVGWARLRCPWAAEGPGRASSRRAELPNSDPAPQVWRAPEGPEGLVAVPVGGGRARAGLEIDHSEPSGSRVAISRAGRRPPAHTAARPTEAGPAARTASGRAAAHRHTERPDRTRQIMRSGWRARRAELAARTARGRAAAHGRSEQPGLTQHTAPRQAMEHTESKTREAQRKMPTQTPSFTASQQRSQKSYEKYESFIGSS